MEARNLFQTYRPFPRQAEFHRSAAKYRLFGGQAGPGKSTALLWEGVLQACETPGADVLLLRRTYPELETSIILPFRRDVPYRDIGGTFNEAKHICYIPNGGKVSTIRFGYSESEHDIYQYQGGEFKFIGVDELTMFTLTQWQFLTSRNRCPVPGARPCMAGASNPGNIGHGWVKALWIDRVPAGGMRLGEYHAADYAFIRARLEDNPVYAKDAEYIAVLEALPTHMRKMFREGDWNVFAGQFFDIWNAGRHVVKAADIQLEPWMPRWISGDWGFQHPAVVHLHAQVEKRTITYAELWAKGMGPADLARAIRAMTGNEHRYSDGPKYLAFYFSPDAWARRTDAFPIAQQLAQELEDSGLPAPVAASTDRIGGARMLYSKLREGQWLISEACPKLVECMPLLIHADPPEAEDVMKVDHGPGQLGDDAYDSARYGLYSHFQPGARSKAAEIREHAEAQYKDPIERWNYLRMNLPKEAQAGEPFRMRFKQRWEMEEFEN